MTGVGDAKTGAGSYAGVGTAGSVGADALDGVSGVNWSYIGSFLPGSVVTCERLMPGGWSDRLAGS